MIAADVEELVVEYLSRSFTNVGLDMPTTPPLPFYLVTALPGDVSWTTEYNLVDVEAFAATRTAAADAGRALHSVMNPWVFTPKLSFTLSNGITTGIDSFCIWKKPGYKPYENPNLFRYIGRYKIDLRMNQSS